jgi:hypothetical protein
MLMSFDICPSVAQLIASRIKYSGWLQYTAQLPTGPTVATNAVAILLTR